MTTTHYWAKLSSGKSLRDIKNWLALAQRQAVTRAVGNRWSSTEPINMIREDLLGALPKLTASV
jgi:hypothetical protein